MAEDGDLIKLYSKRILALSSEIAHAGRLSDPQASVTRRSPLCGSTVTVDLSLEEGRIAAYGQDVKACALGQASAAVSGAQILGCDRETVQTARNQLSAMLKTGGPVPDAPFEGLEVLMPARDYKNRHASIMLTLDATLEAMDLALSRSGSATSSGTAMGKA